MRHYLEENEYIKEIKSIDPVDLNILEAQKLQLLEYKQRIKHSRNLIIGATFVVVLLAISAPHLRPLFSFVYAGVMAYASITYYTCLKERQALFHELYLAYRKGSGQITVR